MPIEGVQLRGEAQPREDEVLEREALAFVAHLHRTFNPTRERLLTARRSRQARLDRGEEPRFLPETAPVREGPWRVASAPPDLLDRRVEITGPVDRKMMINALNSGAKVFMADFEDANSPTWANIVAGQANLIDATERTIELRAGAKHYTLGATTATLVVRPRGWHLPEKHVLVDGVPASASLVDFGLHFFHNAKRALARGTGPYYYLPKLESHLEARLWNDVFVEAQDSLGVPRGTIRATVLIETILAAFEMDEILHELREHSAGLNAGRWDYIFSAIKKFRNRPDVQFPDRAQVTMDVPFMRAYTRLLVATCHRRGAHAIGGMAAFIPNRRDPAVTERALAKVRADKERESGDGFDGTWVAHPDLVPIAMEVFDAVLGDAPNQIGRRPDDVHVAAKHLLDFAVPGGRVTEQGLRDNVSVGIQYIESWLRGTGAAAIHDLMEDAATAEISRSQLWQWIARGATLDDGRVVERALVERVVDEEMKGLRAAAGPDAASRRFDEARDVFARVALDPSFPEFLTLPAYERID